MQFSNMPGRGRIVCGYKNARGIYKKDEKVVYVLSKKLLRRHSCFVDIEKAFDKVSGKVMEQAMRKKGIPELIVTALMSLYHGAKM